MPKGMGYGKKVTNKKTASKSKNINSKSHGRGNKKKMGRTGGSY